MDAEILRDVGKIAGLGGLSLGVFLLLFRDIIKKNIFPNLKQDHAYLLLRLISILVWSVALAGIFAWIITNYSLRQEHGNINITSFKQTISSGKGGESLEQFINANRGKIVYVSTEISPTFVQLEKIDNEDGLFVASEPCEEPRPTSDCAGFHLILNGKDYICEYHNQGLYIFNGYFVVEENRWLHQGIYYRLKSIPREEVLLRQ